MFLRLITVQNKNYDNDTLCKNYSIHLAQWMAIDRQRKKTTTMSQFISITMKLAIWRPAFVKYADNTFTSLSKSWDFLHDKILSSTKRTNLNPCRISFAEYESAGLPLNLMRTRNAYRGKKYEVYLSKLRKATEPVIKSVNAIKPRSGHGGNRNIRRPSTGISKKH